MKRITILALCVLLTLGMAACGNTQTAAPTAAPTEAPTEAPTAAPTEEPTQAPAAEAPTQAPAETNDAVEEAKALVLSLKGKPVQALYDALGKPTGEPEYASSCLVQGGKDGVLPYDGFTVYTLVQADGTETVYDVE